MGFFYQVYLDGTKENPAIYKVGCSRDTDELVARKQTYKGRDIGNNFISWPVRCYLGFEREVLLSLYELAIPMGYGA